MYRGEQGSGYLCRQTDGTTYGLSPRVENVTEVARVTVVEVRSPQLPYMNAWLELLAIKLLLPTE